MLELTRKRSFRYGKASVEVARNSNRSSSSIVTLGANTLLFLVKGGFQHCLCRRIGRISFKNLYLNNKFIQSLLCHRAVFGGLLLLFSVLHPSLQQFEVLSKRPLRGMRRATVVWALLNM